MNVYRNIDRQNVQFDFLVASTYPDSYEQEITDLGGKVYYMPNPLSVKILAACRYCSNFFRNHQDEYDAVHLHCPTMAHMTIRFAHKENVKKIIIHAHSTQFSTNVFKRFINHFLIKKIECYATDFWCCSPEAGSFLFGNIDAQFIPNAIDIERYRFSTSIREVCRKNLGISENTNVICHVSNFSPLKNIFFLIPIIATLTSKDSRHWKFLFVGEGGELSRFQKEIEKLNLARHCIFCGLQTDITPYLSASDFFVMPSINEGFSIALLEAQTNGLICLASDSIPRCVDVTGTNFLPLNNKLWLSKILSSSINKVDYRISCCNLVGTTQYYIKNQVKEIEKLYCKKY